MKFIKQIFAAMAVTLLTACTTDININLDSVPPELVVNGVVSTDTTAHTISLKKTGNYFSNQAAAVVSGATVSLSDGTSTVVLTENPAHNGDYQTFSSYYGVVGRTYTLTISNVDVNADGVKETYTASSTICTAPPLEKMIVQKTNFFNKDYWAIKIWMQDPPHLSNNYMCKVYKNNVCLSDSIQEWGVTDDEFFDGVYLKEEDFMYLSSDKKDEVLKNGDQVTFEINGITKDYLSFIAEAVNEFWGRNPIFGGQPSNIRTNIKQIAPVGASGSPRGYFAAYSTRRMMAIYSE